MEWSYIFASIAIITIAKMVMDQFSNPSPKKAVRTIDPEGDNQTFTRGRDKPPTIQQKHSAKAPSRPRLNNGLPILELLYTNTSNQTFKRLVEPYKGGATVDTFDAWCHYDQCRRSFWFLRIQYAIDTNTGEMLSPAAVYQVIHPNRKRIPTWISDEIEY